MKQTAKCGCVLDQEETIQRFVLLWFNIRGLYEREGERRWGVIYGEYVS